MAIGVTNFPTSLDTVAELIEAANNSTTTLNGALDNSTTTITVASTSSFPSSGTISIDSEIISYTGKTGTTFTGCTRAFEGTSAASHDDGATVDGEVTARHHNVLASALIVVETKLGSGSSTSTANTVLLGNGTGTSAWGAVTNAYIDASAAIAVSKLAAVTASRALVSDASGFLSASAVTSTELGYVSGVTSAIQTQLNAKQAAFSDQNANIVYAGPATGAAAAPAFRSLVAADIPDISATYLTVATAGSTYLTISNAASTYQPLDSDLTAIAALSPTDDDIIQRKAGAWTNRTMAQLKTDLSLSASDVGLGSVENTALSTWAGSSNITTLGTVTTGTLSTGAVIGGVTMTLGTDGTGDIYYRSAGGVLTRLAAGTDGHVLTLASGLPSWAASSGGGLTVGTTAIASGTVGRVLYEATGNVLGEAAGITYQTGASPTVTITAQNASYVGLRVNSAATPSTDVFQVSADNGTTTHFKVTSTGAPSSPGAGSNSERYGATSLAAGANATAFGYGASASNTRNSAFGNIAVASSTSDGIAIGYNARVSGSESFAVGTNTQVTANNAIGISGSNLTVSGSSTIALYTGGAGRTISGQQAVMIGNFSSNITTNSVIALGNGIPSGTNEFVASVSGSTNNGVENVYFGKGVTNATPTAYTINGTGGSGTNIAGADLQLAGGKGTGTGAAGKVSIQTAPAGTSGSSLNTLVTALQVDADTTAGNTRLLIYDVDNATLERVSVGAADSGGSGFKVLRIPN